jgi:hypothetical protein
MDDQAPGIANAWVTQGAKTRDEAIANTHHCLVVDGSATHMT